MKIVKTDAILPVKSCDRCAYGEQIGLDANNIGQPRPVQCRFGPPAAQIFQQGNQTGLLVNFPLMQPDNWCWQYRYDSSKETHQ